MWWARWWAVCALTLSLPLQAHEGEVHREAAGQASAPVTAGPGLPAALTTGAAGREAPQRLSDGSLFVPKAQQRQLGLRTVVALTAEIGTTLELAGRVVADPAAGGRVHAPQAGIVLAGSRGFPVPGQRVRRGELLLRLKPQLSSLELAAQRAELTELDAQARLAARRAERLQALEGSVAAKDIEAARIEQQSLQQRLATRRAALQAEQPLAAPADGVIGAVHVAAGSVVDARELLVEIVDPDRLLVEALAYDPAAAAAIVAAEGQAGTAQLVLQPLGAGLQLRGQALPLLMRVSRSSAAIAVGQPVKVWARTAAAEAAVVLPRSALSLTAGGDTVVWVHTEAERFEARRLVQRPLDATRVAVVRGVTPGERVVSQGATLLTQVR